VTTGKVNDSHPAGALNRSKRRSGLQLTSAFCEREWLEGSNKATGIATRERNSLTQNCNEVGPSLAARLAAVLALVAALLVIPLAFAARADAFIYWTDPHGFIGRATNDGRIVDPVTFFLSPFRGLAVDANHLYWSDFSGPFVTRTDLDGIAVDPFILTQGSLGVAVDANHIYWADFLKTPPSIGRANLDGTGVEPDFIPIPEGLFPWGVAVDADHIYWTNVNDFGGSIGRANLDGTGVDQNFITPPDGLATHIAVDANHIYWSSHLTSSIGRANLDGTGVDLNFIQTAAFSPEGVAVDANHIYWSNKETIGRGNLDGTGVDQNFVADGNPLPLNAFAVAVDSRLPTDAAMELIVPKTSPHSRKTSEEFVIDVRNVGPLAFTASPSDVVAHVIVNGSELGVVTPKNDQAHTFAPDDEARFHFEWTYDGLWRGDIVQHSVFLDIAADVNKTNNIAFSNERTAR
jgi:hypothetical protein